MTSLLPTRRRADAFADALDALLDGPDGADTSYTVSGTTDPRFERLLAVVSDLGSAAGHDDVRPSAAFTGELRERLMSAAETELVAIDDKLLLPTPDRSRARRRQNRISAGIAALAVVAGTTGVAVAASRSVPGDSLYPFKRGVEQARSALALGQAARGDEQLDQAQARLDEVTRMVRGAGDEARLSATLDAFTDQAGQGADTLFADYQASGDDATVRSVREFTAAAMPRLRALAARAPASAQPALAAAARTLTDLDDEARLLCPGCASGGSVSTPKALSIATLTLEQVLDPAKDGTVGGESDGTGSSTGSADGGRPRADASPGVELPDVEGALDQGAGGNLGGLTTNRHMKKQPLVISSPTRGSDGPTGQGGSGAASALRDRVGGTLDDVDHLAKGLDSGLGQALNGLTGGMNNDSRLGLSTKKHQK